MENLNDNVCIFPESLRSNEGATARDIGSSEPRATLGWPKSVITSLMAGFW